MDLKLKLNKFKKKVDRVLEILKIKDLSTPSDTKISTEDKYNSIQVGQLTNEEMIRFNLGPYSKKSTPGSVSL